MSEQGPTRPPTWLQVAVSNAGILKAATAITWAWVWGITRADLGRDPSVEEVAEWWGASVRTCYRDLAAFRKAFPWLSDPTAFVDQAEVKPAIEAAARNMAKIAERLKNRKLPTDMAMLKIGFTPCAYPI
jgi:hypothetical protein